MTDAPMGRPTGSLSFGNALGRDVTRGGPIRSHVELRGRADLTFTAVFIGTASTANPDAKVSTRNLHAHAKSLALTITGFTRKADISVLANPLCGAGVVGFVFLLGWQGNTKGLGRIAAIIVTCAFCTGVEWNLVVAQVDQRTIRAFFTLGSIGTGLTQGAITAQLGLGCDVISAVSSLGWAVTGLRTLGAHLGELRRSLGTSLEHQFTKSTRAVFGGFTVFSQL